MRTIKFIRILLLTTVLATAGLAAAHGDLHVTKPGPVKKEQKDWGIAGDTGKARRTVVVAMSDNMRFTPDAFSVKQGETIRIVVRNQGKLLHEFVLGTRKEVEEHAALMLRFPDMEHDEPYMAHVPPGQTGEIVWTFNRVGDFDFACLMAGHYQAGMTGKITVAATTPPSRSTPSSGAQR
jgi:uncharacterized cupredoxin-like copper-binding protein